jgi:hypothetical protein
MWELVATQLATSTELDVFTLGFGDGEHALMVMRGPSDDSYCITTEHGCTSYKGFERWAVHDDGRVELVFSPAACDELGFDGASIAIPVSDVTWVRAALERITAAPQAAR